MTAAEKRLSAYFVSATLCVLIFNAVLDDKITLAGDLKHKVRAYQQAATHYDLVFIGDSRTYCGIHPHRLNPLLKRRVANLAGWAHWLPTQYAQLQDIVDYIPADTTLVWTVGFQNFLPCRGCSSLAYPIGLENAQFYASLGIPPDAYTENVKQLRPLQPGRGTRTMRLPLLYDEAVSWLQAPLALLGASTLPARVRQLAAEQGVVRADLVYHQNTPTSIERTFADGGYERIEVDTRFFRQKQAEYDVSQHLAGNSVHLHEAYFALFVAGLDLLRDHNIDVIVNVIEESPHVYASRDIQLEQRRRLDQQVRQAAQARGFRYVRPDFDQLSAAHYFDYNHLNSQGAELYSSLLAEQIKPLLSVALASN